MVQLLTVKRLLLHALIHRHSAEVVNKKNEQTEMLLRKVQAAEVGNVVWSGSSSCLYTGILLSTRLDPDF